MIASADSGRTSSSTASAPRTRPSAMTCRTVRPSRPQASAAGSGVRGRVRRAGEARRPRPTGPSTDGPSAATGQRLEAGRPATARSRWPGPRRRWHGRADAPSPPRPTPQAGAVRSRRAARNGGQHRLAFGQRARLVEDDDVEIPRAFESDPVLHQQAIARPKRRRDGDHERDRQAQRVRAGDDQHGRGPDERAGPGPRRATSRRTSRSPTARAT